MGHMTEGVHKVYFGWSWNCTLFFILQKS